MEIELGPAREFVTELVQKAGEILNTYFKSQLFSSQDKEGVDFKTQADDEVDRFLIKHIHNKYPQTEFLTEETAPKYYSAYREKNNVWIIDPLDGTTNFSRGNPHFSISIALVDKGVPRLGVVYLPYEKKLYIAQEGIKHASLNGQTLKVSKTGKLAQSVIAVDWSWDIEKRKNIVKALSILSPHVRAIKSMGTAAGDLASLAQGSIDAYIHSGLKPWDEAAAALLIKKAGGQHYNSNWGTLGCF